MRWWSRRVEGWRIARASIGALLTAPVPRLALLLAPRIFSVDRDFPRTVPEPGYSLMAWVVIFSFKADGPWRSNPSTHDFGRYAADSWSSRRLPRSGSPRRVDSFSRGDIPAQRGRTPDGRTCRVVESRSVPVPSPRGRDSEKTALKLAHDKATPLARRWAAHTLQGTPRSIVAKLRTRYIKQCRWAWRYEGSDEVGKTPPRGANLNRPGSSFKDTRIATCPRTSMDPRPIGILSLRVFSTDGGLDRLLGEFLGSE